MTYDFIKIDKNDSLPLYQQLYNSISQAVETGLLPHGTKLPSIRRLSEDLNVSRTTIESAYHQLSVEGFIISRPQSGYFINTKTIRSFQIKNVPFFQKDKMMEKQEIQYNLSSDCIDSKSADIKLWSTHIKDILKKQPVITSYGEPQGEAELRSALAFYSYTIRSVIANEDHIVIGAGTQPLLYLLCGLLRSFDNTIAIEKGAFQKAEQVFSDAGFETVQINHNHQIDINDLYRSGIKILFVNPSENLLTGKPIQMESRYELLNWAETTGGIIIEDDHNGELRYSSRPIPALQGNSADYIVYLGSFSKLLLPSVRIGYMVLPEMLMEIYRQKAFMYNQTASKIEQLALARYIKEGQLDRQLRKLRKIYAQKSGILTNCLEKAFGEEAEIILCENSLCINLILKKTQKDWEKLARQQGLKLTKMASSENDILRLGFAGIEPEDIPKAVDILKNIYFS